MDKQKIIKKTVEYAKKELAEERHEFMEQFIDRFLREWEGKI